MLLRLKSDYIRDKLSYIESKVKNDTKQKLYDINTTAEDIFMHILNDVYGWDSLKMFYIKDKPKKFTKATETKIANQNMNNNNL